MQEEQRKPLHAVSGGHCISPLECEGSRYKYDLEGGGGETSQAADDLGGQEGEIGAE